VGGCQMTTPAARAVIRAVQAALPIDLESVRAGADLLTRCDRSYALPAHAFASFAAHLTGRSGSDGAFRSLCIADRRWFAYHSVYYDTPELQLFDDHRKVRRHRYKIRERLYVDSGERQFEIKLKGPRGETIKHRTEITERPGVPRSVAWNPHTQQFTARVLKQIYGVELPKPMRPALVTDYIRSTFATEGQRITCDVDLVCRDLVTGRTLRADPELVLIEVKAEEQITAVDRLMHRLRARPLEFNKFCAGLTALRPALHGNLWRRDMRRFFPEAGSAGRQAVRP
jgi:hypothetical protein